ncbi:MAG: YfiR family protein [Desulfobacterales bacterium]|nr:YfiR family protein [Desulfobacterales bacterium]
MARTLKYYALVLFFSLPGFVAPAAADEPVPLEYRVKAAYLYNFLKFVEWPRERGAETPGPYIIGVIGDDPFGKELVNIGRKTVKGRRLKIKRFHNMDELETCHILFICASEWIRIETILKSIGGTPVLTVSDLAGFAQRGGMINLVKTGKTVCFEINRAAAEKAGLKISSKLLKLAKIIKKERPE